MPNMTGTTTLPEAGRSPAHRRLMSVLDGSFVDYRVIDHEAEGHTLRASDLRGHEPAKAAKCMVVQVRKKATDARVTVLAVVPGDRRVDFKKVRRLFGGADASLADQSLAERITGCVSGCIIPFSFDAGLHLVVDPGLLVHDEIYFNAARLDQSIALDTEHFRALSDPLVAPIAR
ncbi:YbaK/EbsC family protein [Streptomyces sp. NPDC059002]|uniref:YbaK/EbsC family protein n=1 Tax=Streptomyces sp. NPDC059002 TaxID=3346690 RepID=UPI0036CC1C26